MDDEHRWDLPVTEDDDEMIDDLDEFAGLTDDPELEESDRCMSCGGPMRELGITCPACRRSALTGWEL